MKKSLLWVALGALLLVSCEGESEKVAEMEEELRAQRMENLRLKEKQVVEEQKVSSNNSNPQNYVDPQNLPGKFPQASLQILNHNDVNYLSARELKIMRNEIFARHGYIFKTDDDQNLINKHFFSILMNNLINNKEKYNNSDVSRFRVSARPKYPAREFTTSSIYLTEYALPQDSYWAIKDEFSGNMIVDFDTTYTKISADNTSSYFDLYMDTLQPERYYRLLIKTTLAGSTTVLDQNNIFKVVKNV